MKVILLSLLFLTVSPALALTIKGKVAYNQGCTGARVSRSSNGISSVVKNSPAEAAGLRKGDIVISSEGTKGTLDMIGPPGEVCHLVIRRKINGSEEIIKVDVVRAEQGVVYAKQVQVRGVKSGIVDRKGSYSLLPEDKDKDTDGE